MTLSRSLPFLAVIALLAACTAPPPKPLSKTAALEARETAALDKLHLRQRYKDAVMGYGVRGATLDLFVDRNTVESEDEAAEEAMLTDVLGAWKKIWRSQHRDAHATLHVSMRDYYGNELVQRSAAV